MGICPTCGKELVDYGLIEVCDGCGYYYEVEAQDLIDVINEQFESRFC